MFSPDEIKSFREETPGCVHFNHLNNCGSSLMPSVVAEAIKAHTDLEAEMGGYEAHAFSKEPIRDAYVQAAQFLGTNEKNIAYVANATDAFARAISSIPLKQGDLILTSEDDYISNQILYLSLQKRWGVRLERVPCAEEGGIDVNQAEKMIRELKPKVVAVTHVPTNSGLVQDVYSVGEICAKYNTTYIIDACQSVGQLPINLSKLKCDFMSATMRKFLRGPRGAGFLYVSDHALDSGLEPLFIDMQGAEWIEKDRYQPVDTAQRFEDWEFAYALVRGSGEAFRYANQIGMEAISERCLMLAGSLRNRLEGIDKIRVLDEGNHLCAIVTCEVPADDYMQLKQFLQQRKINAGISLWHFATIDFQRKGVEWALRLAPHYFNTDEELFQVIDALEEFVK